jgi:hypothetical protein
MRGMGIAPVLTVWVLGFRLQVIGPAWSMDVDTFVYLFCLTEGGPAEFWETSVLPAPLVSYRQHPNPDTGI